MIKNNNLKLSKDTLRYIKNVESKRLSMNKKEELQLVMLAHSGDLNARNKLIESNLYIVTNVVSHFLKFDIPVDDFIQIGNQKLIKCIDEFNSDKDQRLTTFIYFCVYRDMLNKFNEIYHGVSIPTKEKIIFNIYTGYYRYINEVGFEPDNDELAKLLNIETENIDEVFNSSRTVDNYGLYETSVIRDKSNYYTCDYDGKIFNEEFVKLFKYYLEILEPKRLFTVKYHLGLIDGVEHSFREIGEILGITYQAAQEKYELSMKQIFLKMNGKYSEYYDYYTKERVKSKRKRK